VEVRLNDGWEYSSRIHQCGQRKSEQRHGFVIELISNPALVFREVGNESSKNQDNDAC